MHLKTTCNYCDMLNILGQGHLIGNHIETLTFVKKDLTTLFAFLSSGWPPSAFIAAWTILTMSSLSSSCERSQKACKQYATIWSFYFYFQNVCMHVCIFCYTHYWLCHCYCMQYSIPKLNQSSNEWTFSQTVAKIFFLSLHAEEFAWSPIKSFR